MPRSAVVSVAWSVLLFWSRFGINALVFLVMARWITPAEIGAYGAAFAVVQILQAVQTSGLPEAVIRAEDEDSADTAFWLSTGLGIGLGAIVFAAAPLFGHLFGAQSASYTRALAVVPVVMGLGAVSEAALRRAMMLDRLTLRTALTLIAAGIAAVALAADGWGGWALVAFTIVNNTAASLLNLIMSPWRPRARFDRAHLRRLVADATAISARNVVKSAINPTSQFLVTGILGPAAGGVYLIAVRFVTILSSLSLMPAQYAALPIFAKVRADPERRRAAFVTAAAVMSILAAPIYVGVSAIAPTLLPLILGLTGADVAPVVQGLLFHSPVLVLINLGVPALVGIGRAASALTFTAVQAALNVPVTTAAAQLSVGAVGWSYGLLYYAIAPLFLRRLRDDLGVPVRDVLAAVFRPWFAALVMGAVVWFGAPHLPPHWHPILALAVEAAIGAVVYLAAAALLARPQLRAALAIVARLRR